MTSFLEGRQRLELTAEWQCLKWDEAPEYVGPLQGSFNDLVVDRPRSVKAADLVAAAHGDDQATFLLVVELKDFASPGMSRNQQRIAAEKAKSDQLMSDVVAKVVDSLAGATFSHDKQDTRCGELDTWRAAVGDTDADIIVLLGIEVPDRAFLTVLHTGLKKRLRWIGPRASILVASAPLRLRGVTYTI